MTFDELKQWLMDQFIEDYNNYLCNLWKGVKQKALKEELTEYINKISIEFLDYKDSVNLSFNDFVETYDDYVVAEFYGGLNGNGKWTDYSKVIAELINIISEDYHCWLVSLENDCPDDVFYLKLGIKHKDDTSRNI